MPKKWSNQSLFEKRAERIRSGIIERMKLDQMPEGALLGKEAVMEYLGQYMDFSEYKMKLNKKE